MLRGNMGGRQNKPSAGERLGVSLQGYLDEKRSSFRKNAAVVDCWEKVLPEHMQGRCSLREVTGGVVEIEVEPGAYMHQMRVLNDELVARFERICPRAGVRKIKLVPRNGGKTAEEQ